MVSKEQIESEREFRIVGATALKEQEPKIRLVLVRGVSLCEKF